MNLDFALNVSQFKRIVRNQMSLDNQFSIEFFKIRKKLYNHQISGTKFWELYKKAVAKSLQKNNQTFKKISKKLDKDMIKLFDEAQKREPTKPEKPLIDLKLPE